MQFRGMTTIVLEPKFHTWSFPEMWKVVQNILQQKLFDDLVLKVKEEEWNIGVWIVHQKDTQGLHIKGPSIYRKDKEVVYYIWIPTEVFQVSIPSDQYSDFISRQRIVKKLHQQIYLKYYFDGLVLMFQTKKFMGSKLDVPEARLRTIQAEVEEIIKREE
jgi:hypothetical protein